MSLEFCRLGMTISRSICAGVFLLVSTLMAGAAWSEPVVIYTENYPPYNYLDDHGVVKGLATEKVQQVMSASGLAYEIRLVPWTRGLYFVESDPNALLYSMTRTPSRESRYQWLVPLAQSNFFVFSRKDDTRPISKDLIQSGAFTGACVSNDLGCELFRWVGMPKNRVIRVSSNDTADFRMVAAGRADLYISDINVNRRLRISEGFDPSLTKPVLRLDDKAGFYLVGGRNFDNGKADMIQNALKELMQAGDFSLAVASAITE